MISELREFIEQVIEAFLTKQDQEITFVDFEQDPSENRPNSAWVVHRSNASVDGIPAGWIKISYIPPEKFQQKYATLLDWITNSEGMGNLAKFDFKDPEQAFQASLEALGYGDWKRHGMEKMSPAEVKKFKRQIAKQLDDKFGKRYLAFKEFHLGKPMVDYIFVSEEQRRNGIGVALYEHAAQWMATKGMKLYASGIQSQQAKAAWEWLKVHKGANIGTEGDRTFLSFL